MKTHVKMSISVLCVLLLTLAGLNAQPGSKLEEKHLEIKQVQLRLVPVLTEAAGYRLFHLFALNRGKEALTIEGNVTLEFDRPLKSSSEQSSSEQSSSEQSSSADRAGESAKTPASNRTETITRTCPIFLEIQAGQQSRYLVPCPAGDFNRHELKITRIYPFLLSEEEASVKKANKPVKE